MCGIGVAVALLVISGPIAFAQSAGDRSGPEIWDANRDGVYTCDEWKGYLERVFVLADRNHDGKLDASEFATVRKAGGMLAEAGLLRREPGWQDHPQGIRRKAK
jgi:hypothetical protein